MQADSREERPPDSTIIQAPLLHQESIGSTQDMEEEVAQAPPKQEPPELQSDNTAPCTIDTNIQPNVDKEKDKREKEPLQPSLVEGGDREGKEPTITKKSKKKEKTRPTTGGTAVPPSFFKAMKRHLHLEAENFQKAVHAHQWADPSFTANNTLFFFSPLGTTPKDLKGQSILASCAGQWGIIEEDVRVIGTHPKGRSLVLFSPEKVAEILGPSGITTLRVLIKEEPRIVKVTGTANHPSVSIKIWHLPLSVDNDAKFKTYMSPFGEVVDARLAREPHYPDIPQNKGVVEFAFAPMYFTLIRRKTTRLCNIEDSPRYSFVGDQVCECCNCKGHGIDHCELAWKVKSMGMDPRRLHEQTWQV